MPSITKTCEQCGNPFTKESWLANRSKYCSQNCYHASRTQDLLGKRFGRLLVVEKVSDTRWRSICDCGNEAVSKRQSLCDGKAKSCGCLNKEINRARVYTHGLSKTGVYKVWCSMIQRCINPNNKQFCDYGGRGITISESWRTFENFLADMGQPQKGQSIERIDNNSGYSRENCKWVTRTEQQRNRRTNLLLTIEGVTMCATDWAEKFSMTPDMVFSRLHLGWSAEEAVGLKPRARKDRTGEVRSNSHLITFNGESRTIAEWCRITGINPKTVHTRISRGQSGVQALRLEVHFPRLAS